MTVSSSLSAHNHIRLPNRLDRIIFYSVKHYFRLFFIMKLLCFALCVLLFVPWLALTADDGAKPALLGRLRRCLARTSKKSHSGKITHLHRNIINKTLKEKMAEALAVSNNPKSGRGAVENANALLWANSHTTLQVES